MLGTTGILKIVTASWGDIVNLKPVQSINGPVIIKNSAPLVAATQIYVDDSADNNPRTGTLDTVVPAGETLPFGTITGFAWIQFQWQGTQAVYITTGSAGDTFNVRSTQSQLFLDSAPGGTDTVNLGGIGTDGPLGDVQQITRPVSVSHQSYGRTKLNVFDSGDMVGKSATITSSVKWAKRR